jgi:hypothetical protein
MDLLTTYTHVSVLQVITAPSLFSTLHKSLHIKSSSVLTSHILATDFNIVIITVVGVYTRSDTTT